MTFLYCTCFLEKEAKEWLLQKHKLVIKLNSVLNFNIPTYIVPQLGESAMTGKKHQGLLFPNSECFFYLIHFEVEEPTLSSNSLTPSSMTS